MSKRDMKKGQEKGPDYENQGLEEKPWICFEEEKNRLSF